MTPFIYTSTPSSVPSSVHSTSSTPSSTPEEILTKWSDYRDFLTVSPWVVLYQSPVGNYLRNHPHTDLWGSSDTSLLTSTDTVLGSLKDPFTLLLTCISDKQSHSDPLHILWFLRIGGSPIHLLPGTRTMPVKDLLTKPALWSTPCTKWPRETEIVLVHPSQMDQVTAHLRMVV
jgi:hypothetical protein